LRPDSQVVYLKNPPSGSENRPEERDRRTSFYRGIADGKDEKFMKELERMIAFTELYKKEIESHDHTAEVNWAK